MRDGQSSGTFGAWLRTRRKQLDLTQAELGRRAGCSGAAIRKIEAGERKPSRQLAELLAGVLQISPAERDAFLQLSRGVYTDVPISRADTVQSLSPAIRDNLSIPLTSLVDRTRDLPAVTALLLDKSVRWVTLIGPPGIGKTRLSIESGRQALPNFPDGVWFVDLAQVEDPAFVIPAIARVLVAFDLPPSPDLAQLTLRLKDKNLLLILDNFEQVADAAVDVAQLLKNCPLIKALATSRIALRIYGEHEYIVPSLSVPPPEAANQPARLLQYEAVQLLIARIRQHHPDFTVQMVNAFFVFDICTAHTWMASPWHWNWLPQICATYLWSRWLLHSGALTMNPGSRA